RRTDRDRRGPGSVSSTRRPGSGDHHRRGTGIPAIAELAGHAGNRRIPHHRPSGPAGCLQITEPKPPSPGRAGRTQTTEGRKHGQRGGRTGRTRRADGGTHAGRQRRDRTGTPRRCHLVRGNGGLLRVTPTPERTPVVSTSH